MAMMGGWPLAPSAREGGWDRHGPGLAHDPVELDSPTAPGSLTKERGMGKWAVGRPRWQATGKH